MARSARGYKLRKCKDYKNHLTIVERVERVKNHDELRALKGWFESPANQMSSKTERRFCDAYKIKYEELCEQDRQAQIRQALSNQT